MSEAAFIKSLVHRIAESSLLERDARVVIGVSGGPDSMALLHGLVALNEEHGFELELHVAHLDHRLRGFEAEKDAAFVQAAADGMSLPCSIESKDIAHLVQEQGGSVEEVARGERYAFLERVALRCGARAVAVGHQADDNAETILHRIIRGTGLRGLGGIPRKRAIRVGSEIQLLRPLLGFTRREIIDYLATSGVPYREDRTNKSLEAMRNRIRHSVLPLLESQINPQVREALLRLGEQATWLEEFLTEMVQKTLETLVVSRTDQELVLNAIALRKRSRIVQTELVRRAITSFDLGEQDIGFAQIMAVIDLISDPASGKETHVAGGMVVSKRYDQLIFSLPTDEPREALAAEIAVHVPGTTLLSVRRMAIECEITDVTTEEILHYRAQHRLRPAGQVDGPGWQEWIDYDTVRLPLIIRKRQSGDRFWPLGAPGSKKLSEFLTGAKVDPRERDRVAVLCDQLGPIWIIGQRIDERVKMTLQTRRVLKLRATRVGD